MKLLQARLMNSDALCSQPTYEGLKLFYVMDLGILFVSSQPTYEGLKRGTGVYGVPRWCRSQPTYEGLKLLQT